jgi:hypothetical protein
MQAAVNPGEAKQIEQDYAHTTLASSEMALNLLQVSSSQSSICSPSTRSNSRMLWVTRVRLLAKAIAAICKS